MSSLLSGTLSAAACSTTPGNFTSTVANSFVNPLKRRRTVMSEGSASPRNPQNQMRDSGTIRTALPSRPMSSRPSRDDVTAMNQPPNESSSIQETPISQRKSASASPPLKDTLMLDASSLQSPNRGASLQANSSKASSPPGSSGSQGGQVCRLVFPRKKNV